MKKRHLYSNALSPFWRVITTGLVCTLLFGCSSLLLRKTADIPESANEPAIELAEAPADSSSRYENEEMLLDTIIQYRSQAQDAHVNFDFGLAETMIDSAFMVLNTIEIDHIGDEDLVDRIKSTVFSLGKELGNILSETDKISKEDYTSWIDELENIEDFKSGRWSDEELRKIVVRISLKSDVPIDYTEQVKKAIYFFQTNRRKEMTKWLQRSGTYLPMLREILAEEGLPQDIAYLSMIESGFNPNAYSRARAVGLWQFIYSTGRLYGLKRNEWIDERKDPVKSTRAAAKHLKDLYNIYYDWNLSMAAYNCGPARVTRQYNKTPDIDYWDMTLPSETRSYVPFFMAALIIAKEPELFGFENIVYDEPFEFEEVEVHPYTSLSKAAKCAGVDVDELRALNVELSRDRTPAGNEMYALKIPVGTKERFAQEYARLEIEKYVPPRVSTYKVKKGDTLSGIARKFNISLTSLMRENNLKNQHRLSIGQSLRLPGSAKDIEVSTMEVASRPLRQSVSAANGDADTYTVRKNDTLSLIADKFKTSVANLQKLNDMGRSTRIYVGQQLNVPQSGRSEVAVSSARQAAAIDTEPEQITYIVQEGDSLYDIARTYSVDYKDIKRWNKIKDPRKIQPGQKIIIKRTKG